MKLAPYAIVGVLVLSGCRATLHKDYRFEAQEQDLGWAVLHAKLRGRATGPNGGLSSRGSPYELLVWFSVESKPASGCEMVLESLSLVSMDKGIAVLDADTLKRVFRQDLDGTYFAYFAIKDLELEYVVHKLQITYHSSMGCSSIDDSSSVELVFHRDYQEREITFWDSLMGV